MTTVKSIDNVHGMEHFIHEKEKLAIDIFTHPCVLTLLSACAESSLGVAAFISYAQQCQFRICQPAVLSSRVMPILDEFGSCVCGACFQKQVLVENNGGLSAHDCADHCFEKVHSGRHWVPILL